MDWNPKIYRLSKYINKFYHSHENIAVVCFVRRNCLGWKEWKLSRFLISIYSFHTHWEHEIKIEERGEWAKQPCDIYACHK